MAMNDPLAGALSHIKACEELGRKECIVHPSSKMTLAILQILQDNRYLGSFEVVEDGKGNIIKINLLGKVNKCGVIKPRFAVKKDEFVRFEKRYLPSRGFGVLIVSTPKGILTHVDALKQGVGGRLLAYCY